MSDMTPRLGLPWLMPAQAQKHVTVNEALGRLDALVQGTVLSRTLSVEPTSPTEGASYILPASSSGSSWANFDENDLVYFQDNSWHRIAARLGLDVFVEDEAERVLFDGSTWISARASITDLENLSSLGIGTSPDANNPFAAKLNAALWSARFAGEGGSGDLRYTLNKEAEANVLSLLFQSAWSGRAEVGLNGSDNLSIKVSEEGSNWTEALSIDRTDGAVQVGALSLSDLSLKKGGRLEFGANPRDVVRRVDLGSTAFTDIEAVTLSPVRTVSSAYTISGDALGCVILQTSASDLTLPDTVGLPPGWQVCLKNRSGSAIDLVPGTSVDVLEDLSPGTSLSLADNSAHRLVLVDKHQWERC